MPSVSSARRSAVGSVDMRAENKSQQDQAGKDKEKLLPDQREMKRKWEGSKKAKVIEIKI
jgi:hypothetical protein